MAFVLSFFSPIQMTPLHTAAENGRSQMVGYLADKETDINTKDKYGVRVCDYATLVLLTF